MVVMAHVIIWLAHPPRAWYHNINFLLLPPMYDKKHVINWMVGRCVHLHTNHSHTKLPYPGQEEVLPNDDVFHKYYIRQRVWSLYQVPT